MPSYPRPPLLFPVPPLWGPSDVATMTIFRILVILKSKWDFLDIHEDKEDEREEGDPEGREERTCESEI